MKNKFLSLEWFKQTAEKAIEKVIADKLESIIQEDGGTSTIEKYKKPYSSVKMVNDVLTVVTNDGCILSKPNASETDFHAIVSAKSENEIRSIIACANVTSDIEKIKAEAARLDSLSRGISVLSNLRDFTVDGTTVYLAGTSRSMPQLLVEKFIQIVDGYRSCPSEFLQEALDTDDEFQAHKNFFMWCCLNPRAEVAHELYRFLSENSFKITKQGFFVALRNVVTLHGSPQLVHFVSNAYNKVKAVWKKNPDDYHVFLENGEYKLVHSDKLYEEKIVKSTICTECGGEGGWWNENEEWEDCCECDGTGEAKEEYEYQTRVAIDHGQRIGGLTELYLDLPNREENRFTDDWTKTFDIRIGQLVSMPKEECNWSTQDCAAAGLHFTADQIHYVGCGDQSVIVLINPMKVVGIGAHKGRCYEYLPIMTVPREEATKILHDGMFDTLQLDEQYAIRELESLEEKAKEGFATEAKKYEFNIPSISAKEISSIVAGLNEMKEAIKNRVNTIG